MDKRVSKEKQKFNENIVFDSEKEVKIVKSEDNNSISEAMDALDMNRYLIIDKVLKKSKKSPYSNYLIYDSNIIDNDEFSNRNMKNAVEDKAFFDTLSDMKNTAKNELMHWSFPICPMSKVPFLKKLKLLKKEDVKLALLSSSVKKYDDMLKNIQDINAKEEADYKKMLSEIQSFKLKKIEEIHILQELNRKRRNLKTEEKKREEIKNDYLNLLSHEKNALDNEQSKIDLLIKNKNTKNIDDIIKFIEDNKK